MKAGEMKWELLWEIQKNKTIILSNQQYNLTWTSQNQTGKYSIFALWTY